MVAVFFFVFLFIYFSIFLNVFYSLHFQTTSFIHQGEIIGFVKLCQVCGCRGPLSCGACKLVNYCSKEHQKIDWGQGEHKALCAGITKSPSPGNEKHNYLLEEFDLVTEPEELIDSNDVENEVDQEARRLKDYEEFIKKQKEQATDNTLANVPDEEFDKYTNQIDDDKDFDRFRKRIAADPEQVVRFYRGGKPLWITRRNQLEINAIPPCDNCKAPRIFEFQVCSTFMNV